MSTVRGSVRIRDRSNVTAGLLVETFNTISGLIKDSGMIQVADDEYLGQSKTYSKDGGVGFTKIEVLTSSFDTRSCGYKVYKHPALNFYIKVTDGYVIQSSGPMIYAKIWYQISTQLNGSGGFVSSRSSSVIYPLSLEPNTPAIESHPNDFVNKSLTVSCGDSYFWIAGSGGIHTTKTTTTAKLPDIIDWLGIGVFASQSDNSILCCVAPQQISSTTSLGVLGANLNSYDEKACLRYFIHSNGVWSSQKNGAAGCLSNASSGSSVDGIRVTQSEIVVNGLYHRFNFGFINAVMLNYSDVVNINLTGVTGKYQPLPAMGYADHSANNSSASDNSIVVFPVSS